MHCNPAPPHPPPGQVYNAICLWPPYVDGIPVGYVSIAMLILTVGVIYWIQWRYGSINL